jgi:hypothetical protein
MSDNDHSKRLGVTYAIRTKLNFLDERLWKRFSARRLELIDTLDLSSRKASEQEQNIKHVAESLRKEFNYPDEYIGDFDKLVRAAVQSVRRNRKRSSKAKKGDVKRAKTSQSPPESNTITETHNNEFTANNSTNSNTKFISEIAHITDDHDDVYDLNYSKSKQISSNDHAKETINSMIKPRVGHLPSISHLQISQSAPVSPFNDIATVKKILINHIEKSKSCAESVSKKLENLQELGKLIISSCIAYVFEKSFQSVQTNSILYLRTKLSSQTYLAKIFRSLDPSTTQMVTDEIALISLYTLLGGCIKDFGFETVMFPFCELVYINVFNDYPMIAKNSSPYNFLARHPDRLTSNSLNSLAEASNLIQQSVVPPIMPVVTPSKSPSIHSQTSPLNQLLPMRSMSPEVVISKPPIIDNDPTYKKVFLRFLSQVVEFSYPTKNYSYPRYIEMIENAKSVFNLTGINSILGLRNKGGELITTDYDLERIFKNSEIIELEVFTQGSKAIPIYQLTSTIVPNHTSTNGKIILPPPRPQLYEHNAYIPNDEISPPPILPKFQPLL